VPHTIERPVATRSISSGSVDSWLGWRRRATSARRTRHFGRGLWMVRRPASCRCRSQPLRPLSAYKRRQGGGRPRRVSVLPAQAHRRTARPFNASRPFPGPVDRLSALRIRPRLAAAETGAGLLGSASATSTWSGISATCARGCVATWRFRKGNEWRGYNSAREVDVPCVRTRAVRGLCRVPIEVETDPKKCGLANPSASSREREDRIRHGWRRRLRRADLADLLDFWRRNSRDERSPVSRW